MLGKRAEFVRLNESATRVFQPGLIVQALPAADGRQALRVGFTATKRIGGAVVRNRAKRRMRALWRDVLSAPQYARRLQGYDVVLIAKKETPTLPYANLLEDLRRGLARAARQNENRLEPASKA